MGRVTVKGTGRYFVWHVPGAGRPQQGKEAVDELVRRLLDGADEVPPSGRSAVIFPEYVI